jgi:hypothetical protein
MTDTSLKRMCPCGAPLPTTVTKQQTRPRWYCSPACRKRLTPRHNLTAQPRRVES